MEWKRSMDYELPNEGEKPYNRKMIQGKRSIMVVFIKDTYIKHKRQKGYAEKDFRIKTTKKKQKALKSTNNNNTTTEYEPYCFSFLSEKKNSM